MKNTPSYLLLEKPSSTFILPRRQQYRRFAINGIDYGFHLRHFAPSLLQGHVPREFYDSFDQGWSRVMIARCWNHWRCFVTSVSNILLHLNDIDIPSIQVYFETKYNSSLKVLAFRVSKLYRMLLYCHRSRCIETGLLIRSRNRSNMFRTVLTRRSFVTNFLNYFLKRRRGQANGYLRLGNCIYFKYRMSLFTLFIRGICYVINYIIVLIY